MGFVEPPKLPDFLAADLPFERRGYVLEQGADAGRRLHLIDHGPRDARPVLLMHGNPTWCYLWRRVITRLPELRTIAPDLLGLGLSDRLPAMADHTVARHADAIAELTDALELEDAVLAVQDWGGPIGVAAAARRPQRFAGLVVANTSLLVPENPRGTAFHRFARMPLVSDLVFRWLNLMPRLLHRAQGDPDSISGRTARAYRWPLRRLRDRRAPLALARMVPDSADHPSVPELRRGEAWARAFDGPMALVWGTRDPVLGRALKWHEEAFPQAPVTRTNAGHFLQEEVPDELAAAIRDVISRI